MVCNRKKSAMMEAENVVFGRKHSEDDNWKNEKKTASINKNDNTELISAIVKITITGSAAHERWRSEVIQTVKTLDQLTAALRGKGFDLRLSSVYLRLIPWNGRSIEGKRHVNTTPVKLLRSQNSKYSSHEDTAFSRSIDIWIRLLGFFVPKKSYFILRSKSTSDKLRQINRRH